AIEAQRELFFNAEGKGGRSALSSPHTGTFRRSDLAARLDAFYAVSPGNRFAPTMLEEYGGCPFRYFLRRHLRLAPLELPERELAAKDEGSLVHEVLRACGERLAREGRFPVTDLAAALAVVAEEAQAVFARWERDRFTGGPLLWEVKQEKLLAILGEWLRGEACETSTLLPRLFEHTIEDLEVEDGESARFFLTGKIDRVDVAEASGSVRVVDYKLSGNSQKYAGFLKKEALGVTSFQMPVYLLAAARELARSCPIPFDHFIARYWLLKRGGCRDRDFRTAKEDFTGFFATSRDERAAGGDGNFLNRLCATVRSVRQGDFQITPRGCQQCDFTAVCRYVETFAPEA
ncbi:MAG TPA: PD-(D/E)XK nuclease family protein, partial [Geobacteraceae bacterium]